MNRSEMGTSTTVSPLILSVRGYGTILSETRPVTVVLIGPCTWQRKYVDWEIGSSLRATRLNSRCGLLGILLPNHPNAVTRQYSPQMVPPRLADNVGKDDPYALIYDWSYQTSEIRNWIHRAFSRRDGTPPNNGRTQYKNNRSGDCSSGWQS